MSKKNIFWLPKKKLSHNIYIVYLQRSNELIQLKYVSNLNKYYLYLLVPTGFVIFVWFNLAIIINSGNRN